ncbi:MAG: HAD family hydrolase [Chthoniobacter sp.]|uniref:HAD family hydrolase n=1 Tax=Chthoniobacter sp. TaxID=2510640 RepID=UPI0032A4AD88
MNTHAVPDLPVKAVICTIYGTLLECGPAPADAEDAWTRLWREKLRRPPRTTLAEFNRAADLAFQTEANILSVRGVENPAPYWPAVAELLLPELRDLSAQSAADFLYTHAQLRRSVQLLAAAGSTLRTLESRGVLLGLISNGQPHTPVELALALHAPYAPVESFIPVAAAHGVFAADGPARELEIFTPPLCFWSYSHGFGKPNLHAFQHVATRLRARRIGADEVLMVGSDEAGDLQPARRFGWRTWLVTADAPRRPNTGTWLDLAQMLGLPPLPAEAGTTAPCTS